MSRRNGPKWDNTNSEYEIHIAGTEVAKFTASGLSTATGVTVAGRGTVTQATNITTGVTVNALSGTITTVSQTIAGQGTAEFTVTNSSVAATDTIILSVTNAGNGSFIAGASHVAAGSFKIALFNVTAATAGNSALGINFAVIKQAA